jgi:hypothetical protein
MRVRLEFKPEDLWIGVFWRRGRDWYVPKLHVWVCLIPCFPLHFTFDREY